MVQYLPIIVVLSFINVYMYLRLLKCEQCTCSESYDMYLMADTTGQAVTWSVQCLFSKFELLNCKRAIDRSVSPLTLHKLRVISLRNIVFLETCVVV